MSTSSWPATSPSSTSATDDSNTPGSTSTAAGPSPGSAPLPIRRSRRRRVPVQHAPASTGPGAREDALEDGVALGDRNDMFRDHRPGARQAVRHRAHRHERDPTTVLIDVGAVLGPVEEGAGPDERAGGDVPGRSSPPAARTVVHADQLLRGVLGDAPQLRTAKEARPPQPPDGRGVSVEEPGGDHGAEPLDRSASEPHERDHGEPDDVGARRVLPVGREAVGVQQVGRRGDRETSAARTTTPPTDVAPPWRSAATG